MDNFYDDMKKNIKLNAQGREQMDDPGLDQILSDLKQNSTPGNFKEFMTAQHNQFKPTSWKKIARKVTDDQRLHQVNSLRQQKSQQLRNYTCFNPSALEDYIDDSHPNFLTLRQKQAKRPLTRQMPSSRETACQTGDLIRTQQLFRLDLMKQYQRPKSRALDPERNPFLNHAFANQKAATTDTLFKGLLLKQNAT